VWNPVVPRSVLPAVFTGQQDTQLVQDGAICVRGHCGAEIQLVACGAVQLQQVLKASDRLKQQRVAHSVVYLLEPARFRQPRDRWDVAAMAEDSVSQALFPQRVEYRAILAHFRAGLIRATCRRPDKGPEHSRALGYNSRGGCLGPDQLLFVNRSAW